MILPSFIAFAAKTLEMYYDVMKYATFSRGLWLALCKTCSFHSILQRNLTFSPLTWLGSPIFLFYLLVHTTNFLWVVFNKIWMIRFFAVVNYMVQKFSFCSNLYADVIANIILLHIFINLKIVFNSCLSQIGTKLELIYLMGNSGHTLNINAALDQRNI